MVIALATGIINIIVQIILNLQISVCNIYEKNN